MGHSVRCTDRSTFFNSGNCVPCRRPAPGYEITPNCGYDDDGGRHEAPVKRCLKNTFNDGTGYFCQPCGPCPPGFTEEKCTASTNTTCHAKQQPSTASATTQTNPGFNNLPPESWVLSIICLALLLLFCLFIYKKKVYRKSPCCKAQVTLIDAVDLHKPTQLKDILSPDIVAAPLMCVLDDLDVLEELIVLLDPETQGIKNTKHLASLCNFPSSWVIYTYSLKESKSPLKALLEGITCRHPEWTVGSLAELLSQMGRMDAVMALSKIQPNKLDTRIDI